MDCFTDFYEHLEALTTIPEPELDEDGNPLVEEDFKSDLSFGIEESYFDKVDHASTTLVQFYDRYIADTVMHSALHARINTRHRKNYDDLKLMVMVDVVRAYEGLDHSTRLNCPEGIALLLLLVKFFRPDYFITFPGLKEIPTDIINLDGIVPYISACSDMIDIPSEESTISELLLEAHPKHERTYRVCLYHLFEAVSEVDGVISLSEREYLMTLLRLDDDDVTNDINIDSIFAREKAEEEARYAKAAAAKPVSDFDKGDLNPDPFHLTIEEARVLAQRTGNEAILKAIDEAVWAGEQTVAIDKEYEQIWAEIKN
ncbi:MAG: hypothetical protein IJ714_07805 [Bacteroidales bacterium]|nr:hypothetical protein [Bacteroidales bacterium]